MHRSIAATARCYCAMPELNLEDLKRIGDVIRAARHCEALRFERAGIAIEIRRGHAVGSVEPVQASALPDAGDEEKPAAGLSFVSVTSPAVGVLRLAAGTVGARAPAPGDCVAADATVAAIDVLGALVPVVAPVAGRIAGVLAQEGAAVGYAQPILLIEGRT